MSSRDRTTRASFASLNHPEPPDPEFAAHLRARVLADIEPELRPARVVPFRQSSGIGPATRKRTRWLDIAAVAALLIALISSTASLAPSTGDNATLAIHAPETDQPVVIGGDTAAGDGQYSGPAPSGAGYELLRSIERSSVTIHGTRLYRRFWTDPNQEYVGLEAQDLSSGAVIWRVPRIANGPFVATTAGIVVGLPNEISSAGTEVAPTTHMALLDLETGAPIWILEQVFDPGLSWIHVDDGALVFASESGKVTALEIRTGQERWTYAYSRILPPSVPERVCYSGGDCQERAFWPGSIVSKDGTLYISDSVTLRVYALNMREGTLRWSVDMIERTQSTAIAYGALVAVDGGIVVSIDDIPPAPDTTQDRYYGMWSAETGDEVWLGDLHRAAPISVGTGSTIYIEYIDPEQQPGACCRMAEIDVATGDPVWVSDVAEPAISLGYLSEPGVVLFTSAGDPTRVIGRDDRTHERLWELRLQDYGCSFLALPLAADGTMACSNRRGELRLFRPIGDDAMPEAERVDTVDPSAQDGQTSGRFPSPEATFELLWDDQLTSDDGPFGVSQGWSLQDFWGDNVYGRRFTTNGDVLEARSLQTGDTLWQTPVLPSFPITATSAGVIAALPVEGAGTRSPRPFTLALLDRQNGEVVWQTEREYRQSSELGSKVVVADERSVMFIDESLAVVAIDLVDGSERWRFDATRGRTEAEMIGECTPLSQLCGNRPFQSTQIALFGDTLYAYLPIPAEVVALSAQDGNLRWVVSLPERTGQQSSELRLLATELGVVMIATDQRTRGVIAGNRYFGLWSGADGAERWVSAEFADPMVRAGSSLFVSLDNPAGTDGAPCCTLRELDLATGAVIGERTMGDLQTLALQYFPASDVLQLYRPYGEGSIIRNFLADENDPIAQLLPIPDCQGLMPTPDGNYVLCQRPDFTLAVYRVSEAEATPSS